MVIGFYGVLPDFVFLLSLPFTGYGGTFAFGAKQPGDMDEFDYGLLIS